MDVRTSFLVLMPVQLEVFLNQKIRHIQYSKCERAEIREFIIR